jgi:hypothetical protein
MHKGTPTVILILRWGFLCVYSMVAVDLLNIKGEYYS